MQTEFKRVFIVVLDGVGAGELPDASEYGDVGADTLVHVAAATRNLQIPNLVTLGIANIRPLHEQMAPIHPIGSYGRMAEKSPGKDSVTGHWEMMGIVLVRPFPTYPNGFPLDIIARFEAAIGRKTLANCPASGTEIIERFGAEHVRTGSPIIYTSADSVFQIAAHEAVIPIGEQYAMCQLARDMLVGEHAVGRVICRPFEGEVGHFRRTERRKDYPLTPPENLLDRLHAAGVGVHAIGKISEFFNGRGIDRWDHTTNNSDHIIALQHAVENSFAGFIFANLEDFDMLYGHRNDVFGFARALEEYDHSLGLFLNSLRPDDLLIITNDHGNDPTFPGTDHNREFAHLLVYSPSLKGGVNLGDRSSCSDLSATVSQVFGISNGSVGTSFMNKLVSIHN
ncbi:MAG: phosphopentomutase [Chthonomonadales bacterium]